MGEAAIRVAGLRKQYPGRDGPVDAVNGLDLEVGTGECFGLLGPNGAGKTTTVEILEGLNTPTSGDVEVLGRRWESQGREIRERIGVTLQETRFPEKSTLRELVGMFRGFYRDGLEPDDVLARVTLDAKANSFVEQLSGGQQQRLAVAVALVGDPELLFLDEPTTGLDPQSRRQLWYVILDLRARGRTTVLTTHYMDEAERLCDRVAIIDQGRVIALGSPADLIARMGGEHVVEFALGGGGDGPEPEAAPFSDQAPLRGGRLRPDRGRPPPRDPGAARLPRIHRPAPRPPDHPPGQPRRRLRRPDRPPPPRGGGGGRRQRQADGPEAARPLIRGVVVRSGISDW